MPAPRNITNISCIQKEVGNMVVSQKSKEQMRITSSIGKGIGTEASIALCITLFTHQETFVQYSS